MRKRLYPPMTDMQRVILDEILCHSRLLEGDGKFGSDSIYMQITDTGYQYMKHGDFYIQEASASGGAWWTIGEGHVYEDRIILKIKTVLGFSRNEYKDNLVPIPPFIFQFCVPDFPSNVITACEKAVINARRARNACNVRYNPKS